jgi:hypothetical protein
MTAVEAVSGVVVGKRELLKNLIGVLQFILIPCSNVRRDVAHSFHAHP